MKELVDRKPQIEEIKARFKKMYPELIEIPWDQKLTQWITKFFDAVDRAKEARDIKKGNVGWKKIAKTAFKILESLIYIAGAIFQAKFFKL
jgi:superfamily I DNA and/or RNA helicase